MIAEEHWLTLVAIVAWRQAEMAKETAREHYQHYLLAPPPPPDRWNKFLYADLRQKPLVLRQTQRTTSG